MQNYQQFSDQEWVDILSNPCAPVPMLPPAETQEAFCGRSGYLAMIQAFEFYDIIRTACRNAGRPLESMGSVLEFGCGWGRISRCFLRDIPEGKLYGCDVIPHIVRLCKETIPSYNFVENQAFPPTSFSDNTFDLIYSFSVFSHLSESAHKAWLDEFHRIMKPGGILVQTTRPREFIRIWPQLSYVVGDVVVDKLLREYDEGKFIHLPGGGGDILAENFYGETAIPEKYIRREWTKQFRIEKILGPGSHIDQNVIIAQKIHRV